MRKIFDSEEIQIYCESIGYHFSPAEELAIVSHSNRSLNSKIKMYQEYVDKYSDEEFKAEDTILAEFDLSEYKFKRVVKFLIDSYNEVLINKDNNVNMTYAVTIIEEGYGESDSISNYKFFNMYESAYQFVVSMKKLYSKDPLLSHIKIYGKILKINMINGYIDTFIINNDLEISDILLSDKYKLPGFNYSVSLSKLIYVFIPLPFNKGDIVKCISDNKIYYGVIQKELKSKEDDYHFKSNTLFKSYGGSDMVMNLDCYNLSTKSYYFLDNAGYLNISYMKELSEIAELNELLDISSVRKSQVDMIWLLEGKR